MSVLFGCIPHLRYNINKGCCIPLDTYLGIFSVPDHPGCLVRWVTTPWAHPLWCDDMHLSGTYEFFPTQGIIFCFPKPYFSEQEHIIFLGLFIKIYNNPPCTPKYDCNVWLYFTLAEAEFNVTKTFVGIAILSTQINQIIMTQVQ